MEKLIIATVFLALLGFALAVVRRFWAAYASKRWPTVQGEIVSIDMGIKHTVRELLYVPKVRYRYTVDGKDYENSRIDVTSQRMFYSQSAASAVLMAYRVNGPVTVHYNPRRPKQSLLNPGISVASWIVTGLVIVLLALIATVGLQ